MGRVLDTVSKVATGRRCPLLPTAVATTVLLLILSGCTAPLNAVSPLHTAGGSSSNSSPPGRAAGGTTLVATLTPESPNTSGSGTARLRLNAEQQTLCFVLQVKGMALPATGAHIHRGAAGSNGPIVVPLTPPNAQGVSTGCTHVSSDVLRTLTQHPADYYVNVHNAPYPEGAVRGQLSTCGPRMNC